MTKGLLFWVIMIILLIGHLFTNWPRSGVAPYPFGIGLVNWILLALLGWQVFGAAIR